MAASFLVVTGVVSGVFLAAAPAQAASGPGGSVITCTLKVNYPHNSIHVGGTVNVTSEIKCTSNVDSIYVSTGLRGAQSGNGWAQKFNTNYQSSNAAAPCVNGSYWGVASGTVTFPSGYTPRVQNVNGAGGTRVVDCSVAGIAADDDTESKVAVFEFSAISTD
jgi:hypothetical protein